MNRKYAFSFILLLYFSIFPSYVYFWKKKIVLYPLNTFFPENCTSNF